MNVTPERTYEVVYSAWLLGEETSPAEREQMEARYRDDAAFRTEADELRSVAGVLGRNADLLEALLEPPRPASEREELWGEFQKRKQAKRQRRAVRISRASAATWGEAQWNGFKATLEALTRDTASAIRGALTAPALAMQAASDEPDLQTVAVEDGSKTSVPVRVTKREVQATETGGTVRLSLTIEGERSQQFAGWFLATWLDAGDEGWLELGAAPVLAEGRVNAVLRETRFALPAELSDRLRFTLRATPEQEPGDAS